MQRTRINASGSVSSHSSFLSSTDDDDDDNEEGNVRQRFCSISSCSDADDSEDDAGHTLTEASARSILRSLSQGHELRRRHDDDAREREDKRLSAVVASSSSACSSEKAIDEGLLLEDGSLVTGEKRLEALRYLVS